MKKIFLITICFSFLGCSDGVLKTDKGDERQYVCINKVKYVLYYDLYYKGISVMLDENSKVIKCEDQKK